MDRSELAYNEQIRTIPGERSKNGVPQEVPLGPAAIAIINSLANDDTWPRTGLLFTTTSKTQIRI